MRQQFIILTCTVFNLSDINVVRALKFYSTCISFAFTASPPFCARHAGIIMQFAWTSYRYGCNKVQNRGSICWRVDRFLPACNKYRV